MRLKRVYEEIACHKIITSPNQSGGKRIASEKILLPQPWRHCGGGRRQIPRNRNSNAAARLIYNEFWASDQPTKDRRPALKKSELKQQVSAAIQACLEKKAEELSILEMEKGSGAFTDYFVLCSGTNPRQIQAIADEVELRLKNTGLRPTHVEGYSQAEWILIDYVDFVVHVFSEKARKFYDLERLWKSAKRLEPSALKSAARKRRLAAAGTARKKKQA
jgi:ribosome-associated protein